MKLAEIIKALEHYAPLAHQESYDNSGLVVGSHSQDITSVLCTIDVTEEVIEEAIALKADLIISHHPVIFSGLKSLTGKNYTERTVLKAIKNDIALYSGHTNFDNISNGVNAKICDKLGLSNYKTLEPQKGGLLKLVTFVPTKNAEDVRQAIFDAGGGTIGKYDCCSYNISGKGSFRGGEDTTPYVGAKGEIHFEEEIRIETILPGFLSNQVVQAMIKAHPYEEVAYDLYPLANNHNNIGAGMIGSLPKEMDLTELLQNIKKTFSIPCIRYSGNTSKKIKKVAVCGGSGSFLIKKAMAAKADVFITGDIKYHQFFDNENKMLLVDMGHFESEQFTKEIFYDILTKKFPKFAVHLSKTKTNPIKYFL